MRNELVLSSEGQAILSAARERSDLYGASYAKPSKGISSNPAITSNRQPDKSQLAWLKGHPKCNHFVGDALYDAGFEMPSFRMKDGSKHYMNAERLPSQSRYFAEIESLDKARPGDLIVFDWEGRGEGTAHVEVLSKIAKDGVEAIGARSKGAANRILKGIKNTLQSGTATKFLGRAADVFILRPIRER